MASYITCKNYHSPSRRKQIVYFVYYWTKNYMNICINIIEDSRLKRTIRISKKHRIGERLFQHLFNKKHGRQDNVYQ